MCECDLSGVCTVTNFAVLSVFGTDQIVDGTGEFTGDFFQNVGGHPGKFLGPFSATPNLDFDYANRTSPTQLNMFKTTLTEFDFTTTV
jgi:hypothetical protein